MTQNNDLSVIQGFDWRDLSDGAGFDAWRAAKCRLAESAARAAPVLVDTLAAPGAEAVAELARRCSANNYALYEVAAPDGSAERTSADLVRFAGAFGLRVAELHRSAGTAGVVALHTTSEGGKKGYIPYTPKPLNWHTDGYYNPADDPVNAFVLHCVRQAARGGENQLIDPEIAYMRLREENADFIRALMHPEAMTIPENREADGSLRPASVGPVFYPAEGSGRLQMRYTARTRSIAWRDDAPTRAASDWLRGWLTAGDPLMRSVRLKPGQGVLNNNALHNRTGFEDGATEAETRLILRVRFHNRIAEVQHGTA